jgi:hypothetical protein
VPVFFRLALPLQLSPGWRASGQFATVWKTMTPSSAAAPVIESVSVPASGAPVASPVSA